MEVRAPKGQYLSPGTEQLEKEFTILQDLIDKARSSPGTPT
jgi:hypothetical protein